MSDLKKCVNCGNENFDNKIYCSYCGNEIDRLFIQELLPKTNEVGERRKKKRRHWNIFIFPVRLLITIALLGVHLLFMDYIGGLRLKEELTAPEGTVIFLVFTLVMMVLIGIVLFWERK